MDEVIPPQREMPIPRGYKKTLIPVHVSGKVYHSAVLTCDKCGSLVAFHKTHTDWHKKEGK